jgi:type IV pilus biogenesis protein PilP
MWLYKKTLLALTVLVTLSAQAVTADAPGGSEKAKHPQVLDHAGLQKQLEQLARQRELLTAQAEYQEALNRLNKAAAAASGEQADAGAAGLTPQKVQAMIEQRISEAEIKNNAAPPADESKEDPIDEMYVVSTYTGEDGALAAEVYFRGGRIPVSKGDTLPGDWVIQKVEMSRLILKRGKRRGEIALKSPELLQKEQSMVAQPQPTFPLLP